MGSWSSDQSRLSLASAEADFSGTTMRGLQSITISEEMSADPMYGNGSVSIGAPIGTHKAELTFKTIPEEADNILQSLGPAATRVLGSVGITMAEPNGANPYLINLTNVRILKMEADLGEAGGQKGSMKTFTCAVYDPVDWNGIGLIENPNADDGGIVGFVGSLLGV
jgi:hypothetical protein